MNDYETKKKFDDLFKYIEKKIEIPNLKIYYYDFYNQDTKKRIDEYLDYNLPINEKTDDNIKEFVNYYNSNVDENKKITDKESFINATKDTFKKEINELYKKQEDYKKENLKQSHKLSKETHETIEKDKNRISSLFKQYVDIILNEYQNDIPNEIKNKLKGINNFEDLIDISETETISLFATPDDSMIHLPLQAYSVIKALATYEEYGTDKNHNTHTEETMIVNDNTFRDFVRHVIIKGETPAEYFEEILLHETMHVCGSKGKDAISEGFTELKTRELALKYNLNTSCCGYPKELKIAYELQELFGKDIWDKLTFKSYGERIEILSNDISYDAAKLYADIYKIMEEQFEPYINKKYPGINGIIDKCNTYDEINYQEVYRLINDYKLNHNLTNNELKKETEKTKVLVYKKEGFTTIRPLIYGFIITIGLLIIIFILKK